MLQDSPIVRFLTQYTGKAPLARKTMGSGDQDNGILGAIAGRSQKSLYSGRMGQAGLRGEAGGSDGTSRYRILLLTYCILSSSRPVLSCCYLGASSLGCSRLVWKWDKLRLSHIRGHTGPPECLAQSAPVGSMIWGSEVDLKPCCDADTPGEPDGENFEGAMK